MKADLRTNLWAKCAAVVLALALALGCAAGCLAMALLSAGCGTAEDYLSDRLFTESMNQAMYRAYDGDTEGLRAYAGFSARIYEGDPADGRVHWTWADPPRDDNSRYIRQELVKSGGGAADTEAGYYTVVGYFLWDNVTQGSVFTYTAKLFRTLHRLRAPSLLMTLIILMGGCALALVVFLCCAAGRRRNREGVTANLFDRVPLDILCVAVPIGFVLCCFLVFQIDRALDVLLFRSGYGCALCLMQAAAGFLGCAALALASLLTLCTRFKLGKWWRNTICWRCFNLCRRLAGWLWQHFARFFRSLPMTWRAVVFTGGVFFLHGILMLLFMAFHYDVEIPLFFGFLIFLMDLALILGAAALSLQLSKVKDMGAALAAGDLEAKLDTRGLLRDIRTHAEHLNAIGVGMNRAVEQRMKSERLKTELITNVSHDIKTPLTSIINYVDLLKKEDLQGDAAEYLSVLDRQSKRLKKLTEDLVEASKASTGNVTVHLEPIMVNELVHQAIGDYDEKLAAGRLEVVINTYEGNLRAAGDGRLLWRVLDNLLGNICKYALAGTRVYVDLGVRDGRVFLSLKNISRDPLNVSADELMERFVRGDASRHTEGSGLGLNIAKSLMDLMHGTFDLSVDGDLFKAELTLPQAAGQPDPVPAPAAAVPRPERPAPPPFPKN